MLDKFLNAVSAVLIFALGTALFVMALSAAADFKYAKRNYSTLDAISVNGVAPEHPIAKPPGSVAANEGLVVPPFFIAQ